MGNIFTSLLNATGALQVYGRALGVVENNISNVNTPGYVRQDQTFLSLPFDPAHGLTGGVLTGPVLGARSEFLEHAVRSQQENFGSAQQRATDLAQIEPLFDLTTGFGISSAFNRFFDSFAQLAVNPNDPVARQAVVDQAGNVANAFHSTAQGISQTTANVDRQATESVATVNRLAAEIAQINAQYRSGSVASNDAGLSARLNSALEELSGVVNYSLIKTEDGSATIFLGGQAPLVIGDRAFEIQLDVSGPQSAIRDSTGNDITPLVTGGSLGALLQEKNTTLPGYLNQLHQLATSFSDTVNVQLSQGVDRNGAAPVNNLFTYNTSSDAAFTLAVTSITPDEIAAATPTAPGGNGNALALARLADTQTIGGFTFTQFYGSIGGQVGRDVSVANQNSDQARAALAYVRGQRKDQTGVSLDEEAAKLLQYQQAYQSAGKLIGVLNSLTDTLINLIHA